MAGSKGRRPTAEWKCSIEDLMLRVMIALVVGWVQAV
jgi:hypothetical protein